MHINGTQHKRKSPANLTPIDWQRVPLSGWCERCGGEIYLKPVLRCCPRCGRPEVVR